MIYLYYLLREALHNDEGNHDLENGKKADKQTKQHVVIISKFFEVLTGDHHDAVSDLLEGRMEVDLIERDEFIGLLAEKELSSSSDVSLV